MARPRQRAWYRASTLGTLATWSRWYLWHAGGLSVGGGARGRAGVRRRLQKGGSSGRATGPRVGGERRLGRSPGGAAGVAGSEYAMGAEWRADGLQTRCFRKWSSRGLPVSSEGIGDSVRLGMHVIRRRYGRLVPQRIQQRGASRGRSTIQSRWCTCASRRAIWIECLPSLSQV
jgi:hypothetical protein